MAVKLRLARHGAKKRPFYHIVAADERAPRDGRYIERVGRYNPMLPRDHAERIVINTERAKYWIETGAQPTDRVARFLGDLGIIKKFEVRVTPDKSKPKAKALERIAEQDEKKRAAEEAEKQAKEAAKQAAAAPAEPAPEEAAAAPEVEAESVAATE